MIRLDVKTILSIVFGVLIGALYVLWSFHQGIGFLWRWFDFHGFVILIPILMTLVGLIITCRVILDAAPVHNCPNCQSRSLSRQSISPFGFRYYLCKSCGIRAKRKPHEDWEDASSQADARHFARALHRSKAIPVDQAGQRYEGALVGMHGSLLEQKRLRQGPDENQIVSEKPTPRDP